MRSIYTAVYASTVIWQGLVNYLVNGTFIDWTHYPFRHTSIQAKQKTEGSMTTSTAGYDRVIENLVISNTLRLDGHQWDNTLIRNVTIKNVSGDGIFLRNVDNVRIENSTIDNISGTGIRLSTSGSTTDVTIADNTITNTTRDGIAVGQRYEDGVDHFGLKVIGNHIDTTGTAGSSGLYHGIYVQSSDFHIEGNHVTNSTDGNAISVRSSGLVRGNLIDGTGKSGISYYADHMRGPTDLLTIENNIIVDTGNGTTRSDIDLLSIPDNGNVVRNFNIRNNTVTDTDGAAIVVSGEYAALGIKPVIGTNPLVSESAGRTMIADALANGGTDGGGTTTPPPSPTTFPIDIVVRASADLYNGGAKMAVALDDAKIGEVTVTNQHGKSWADYKFHVDASSKPSELEISFLNDLYGGSKTADRNLWVDYVLVNGQKYDAPAADTESGKTYKWNGQVELLTNGTISWDLAF
ncbi:MAG: right-handed parallel beta-helix repeat-containing protein [Alphaproteobacteria bacterium]|nr:right-handed parallel beta-helix repeat-containing protein [Alphaproteobacteria bacterium]